MADSPETPPRAAEAARSAASVAAGSAEPEAAPSTESTGATDSGSAERHLALGLLTATVAVLAWACPALIGKALPLSSLTVVLFRGWIGVLFALAVLRLRGGRLTARGLRLSAMGGVALGLDLMFFFGALKTTTVANATLVGSMTPLLLVFLAPVLFDERLRWPDILGALVAMGGAATVVLASAGLTGWSLQGDLLALAALASWTLYLVASKRVRAQVSSPEFTAGITLVASLVLTPFALADQQLRWPEPLHWALLLGMAVSGWLGHTLMNWSLRHIPVWAGGTATLAVPVVATALAALFLGESFVWIQGLGMVVVIGALTFVGWRSPKLL